MRWLSMSAAFRANGLGDAQAGRVAGGQDGAMFRAPDAIEKVKHFFWAEDNGQFLRLLGSRDDVFKGPVLIEGDLIEKAESGDGDE